METLFVNSLGIALIALIVWWFWLSESGTGAVANRNHLQVIVDDGVYTPGVIEMRAGERLTLEFLRKDETPCAESVIFDELGVSAELPVGKPVPLTLEPRQPGEYEFTCQMGMYRGKLKVTG